MFMKDVSRFAGGNCVSCPKAHKCGVHDGESVREGARATRCVALPLTTNTNWD